MPDSRLKDFVDRMGLNERSRDELFHLVQTLIQDPIDPGLEHDPGATVILESTTDGVTSLREDVPRSSNPAGTGPTAAERYTISGSLGEGGMGEVRRVLDGVLERQVAMKVLGLRISANPNARARFYREARTIGQLQHPGVVPIYDRGILEDGRPFYTMPEVVGETLTELIRSVHDHPGRTTWNLRRLVDAFLTVCETMAYAHSRGVIHRDLKPSNIMVGAFGEVLVLDWGLAKVQGEPSEAASRMVETHSDTALTLDGEVSGTIHFMPPEQARGEIARLGPASDVYSLGAILYAILSGAYPYQGRSGREVLALLVGDPSAPVVPARRVPGPLVSICYRAMAPRPEDRFDDASEMAREVRDWLEGARKRTQALAVVEEARGLEANASELTVRAVQLRAEAALLLDGLEPWAPENVKAAGWALEDQAAALEREAQMKRTQHEQQLHGALTHRADLPDAHAALAAYYRQRHAMAEEARDPGTTVEMAVRLEGHTQALAAEHPSRAQHLAYLEGAGTLTLHTDPEGAQVWIAPYVEVNRRLIPGESKPLGRTPLDRVPVAMGSYQLRIEASGRSPVVYPVNIEREQDWHGIPPDQDRPHALYLPLPEEVGPGECYVPAGWCMLSGDPGCEIPGPRQRFWVEGFVIQRDPTCNRDYIAFLEALHANGANPLLHIPRSSDMDDDPTGLAYFTQTADGHFEIPEGEPGAEWQHEHPVRFVDWFSATAYSHWRAAQTGLPWQLPTEVWWEKAARGTDGRFFPWGDLHDFSWRHCRLSQAKAFPIPLVPGAFPVDESPYGVRGLAGGVRDWMADAFFVEGIRTEGHEALQEDAFKNVRGGSFGRGPSTARCAYRNGSSAVLRGYDTGIRLARPLPVR